MKCIYVYQVTDPENGYHICDPNEIRSFLDDDFLEDNPEWNWKWDEL